MKNRKRIQGLSLIEVLVTSVVFALLVGLVSQFFVSQSRAASLQRAQNEANESTRTALSLIAWDLQNAGYRVTTSTANPAVAALNNTYEDIVTTRFFDEGVTPQEAKKTRYSIEQGEGETVTSLRRAYYTDPIAATPPQDMPPIGSNGPSVASLVALNVRFETRQDPFVTPNATSCPSTPPSTPVPPGSTGLLINNCSVSWIWSNTPQRLVRRVRIQVLGRSETRVPAYDSGQTYTFEGGGQYATEPGYVYHFAEQTVLVPNLGR